MRPSLWLCCRSPSLVDRPSDWPSHCEVVGFINVELQKLTKYSPPKELADFLSAGEWCEVVCKVWESVGKCYKERRWVCLREAEIQWVTDPTRCMPLPVVSRNRRRSPGVHWFRQPGGG